MNLSYVKLPILCLHRVGQAGPESPVSPACFDRVLGLLREVGAVSVPLASLGRSLAPGGKPLPPKAISICFDDCYADVADNALPILDRHGFKASFFAVAGLVGGHCDWNPDPSCRLPLMGARDLRHLADSGHEVGSHGYWHVSLPRQGERALRSELLESRHQLEDILGRPRPATWPDAD